MRDPCVGLTSGGIIACEVYVQEMQNTLLTPLPVSARGIATMNCILGDGMGPLYDHRRSTDLRLVSLRRLRSSTPVAPCKGLP
jgi:hypothetical protein